ncbi:MAG: hypothetical protein JWO76_1794 [Nocardioides sp.]|nr:hypothetical protein [Nocardioides sp.]
MRSLLLALLVPLVACGSADEPTAAESPGSIADPPESFGRVSVTPHPATSPRLSPTVTRPPCDPGGGFPVPAPGCPDPEPETGWLTVGPDRALVLHPLRTYTNDAEGRAYAESHGLEYPFSNDYFDAADGAARPLSLDPETACTGIIRVGYREPLHDHAVDCADLIHAAARRRLTTAVWREGDRVVQVSELYRP